MSIWKKMGRAVGHAMVQAGKKTAAAIKRKNLQNKVKRMILERFTVNDLKKLLDDYEFEGPEIPERGYLKKSDYVDYAYRHYRLKTIIQWAKDHRIKIKDIMDYYIQEMEKIDEQYGETSAEDKEEGVEEIELSSEGMEAPPEKRYARPPKPSYSSDEKDEYEEIINYMERNLQNYVSRFKYVDEEEFRKTVLGFLSRFEDKHKIEIPPDISAKGDIVIDDGEVILELKYAAGPSTLDHGLNEVMDYKQIGKKVVMVLLDVGEMRVERIKDYERKYLKLGAYRVITVKGQRRVKRRRRSGYDRYR